MEVRKELMYRTQKVYFEDGCRHKIEVDIYLGDRCHNDIAQFSVGACIEFEHSGGRWGFEKGGCCHDEILKYFPEFEKFVKLHLVNHYGTGKIRESASFIAKGQDREAKSFMRINDEELEMLKPVLELDDDAYTYHTLKESGIIDRWKREADEAIAELENLCGCKWVNPYKPYEERFVYKAPSAEEQAIFMERFKDGYYAKENVQRILKERKDEKLRRERERLIKSLDDKIKRAENEKLAMIAVLDYGIDTDNVIYYTHSNKLTFNWKDYGERISQEVFADFVNNVDMTKLPDNIAFEIK